jgi:hypothetical protein
VILAAAAMFGIAGWTPVFHLAPGSLGQSVTLEMDGEVLAVARDRGHAVRLLCGHLLAEGHRYDDWKVVDGTASVRKA